MNIMMLDVQKAYDTVWRDGLWLRLWRMWHVIKKMYEASRSTVLLEGEKSAMFSVEQGAAQGCSVPPLLLSVFINECKYIVVLIHVCVCVCVLVCVAPPMVVGAWSMAGALRQLLLYLQLLLRIANFLSITNIIMHREKVFIYTKAEDQIGKANYVGRKPDGKLHTYSLICYIRHTLILMHNPTCICVQIHWECSAKSQKQQTPMKTWQFLLKRKLTFRN